MWQVGGWGLTFSDSELELGKIINPIHDKFSVHFVFCCGFQLLAVKGVQILRSTVSLGSIASKGSPSFSSVL